MFQDALTCCMCEFHTHCGRWLVWNKFTKSTTTKSSMHRINARLVMCVGRRRSDKQVAVICLMKIYYFNKHNIFVCNLRKGNAHNPVIIIERNCIVFVNCIAYSVQVIEHDHNDHEIFCLSFVLLFSVSEDVC